MNSFEIMKPILILNVECLVSRSSIKWKYTVADESKIFIESSINCWIKEIEVPELTPFADIQFRKRASVAASDLTGLDLITLKNTFECFEVRHNLDKPEKHQFSI